MQRDWLVAWRDQSVNFEDSLIKPRINEDFTDFVIPREY